MRKIAHPFRQELNTQERYVPDVWSREYVASRMLMAAETLKNLNTGRIAPAGFSSCFPEFEKGYAADDVFDDAPIEEEPVEDKKIITSEDISLMEEALNWPMQYLYFSEQLATSVSFWTASDVFGIPKKSYAKKKNITEYYFKKYAMAGFDAISDGLTKDRVKIR